ncbi:hypothetical protein [Clostridium sp.]|uniref:hypothetical protein n=1 Tax=Clostridium sp. TaxID=1506 RepID=UPI002900515C|nr:hypothetical protein [Clostridium sp.]MDU2156348.1 hypothetical protein [Clostridium sp.]
MKEILQKFKDRNKAYLRANHLKRHGYVRVELRTDYEIWEKASVYTRFKLVRKF